MVAQPIMIAASTNIVQPQLMSSEANAGLNSQMALFVLEIKNVFISFVPGVFVPLVTRMHIVHLVNFVATNMCLLLKMFVPDIVTKFVFSVQHAVVLVKLVGGDLRANNIILIKKQKFNDNLFYMYIRYTFSSNHFFCFWTSDFGPITSVYNSVQTL